MRFFKDGPNIPDLLLEKRDEGRVVFLCGAGVSLNAGMPTFYDLTKYVIDFFDPQEGSAIDIEFKPWIEDNQSGDNQPKTPLDQIFHILYQEYGRDEVNSLVAERLSAAKNKTKLTEHQILSRISSDQEGKPQIVTTNFDLLFENALEIEKLNIYVPPAFPDINLGIPLTGITYLHGRLQEHHNDQHSYILSSADFGRAYLSEGWATNFIQSLLKSYTVVLIGYQAEDPPVKYLLQGLNHDGRSDRSNLYAFDKGDKEDIEVKWRDRGVTAIACKDYPSLWQSLEAWAERADDPRQWRSKIINLASKGPRNLDAHERGQVAHLVRTTPGAKMFSTADPSPTPEWLCVFDSYCRIARKSKDFGGNSEEFDPFVEYGLDDDLPRPKENDLKTKWLYDNLLEWRRGDTNPSNFHSLSLKDASGFESMPPRLLHLNFWISKNIDNPIVAWWVSRQGKLHPRLLRNIRIEVQRKKDPHPHARTIWNIILEYQSNNRNFTVGSNWYQIKDRIKNEGWTPSVLRSFDEAVAPYIFIEPPSGLGASQPPLEHWEKTELNRIVRWEVVFPDRYGEQLEVPDNVLLPVFRIVEGHLKQFQNYIMDLGIPYFSPPSCYPNRNLEGNDYEKHEVFKSFLQLFSRMALSYPDITRGYVFTWGVEEQIYFNKIKLYALNQRDLYSGDEVVSEILNLSQKIFWNWENRRELLFLINDRWNDFSLKDKEKLIKRILKGPDKNGHWTTEEYLSRKNQLASRYAGWLAYQDKILPEIQAEKLEEMISKLPEWRDSWAEELVDEQLTSVYHIGTDESVDSIINLPISDVVEQAAIHGNRDFFSNTDKKPFIGLVKENPRKALASLSYKAKFSEYPEVFWSDLISNFPQDVSSRLNRVFLCRIRKLPFETIREIRYTIGRWSQKKLLIAYEFDEQLAWDLFDYLISGLNSRNGTATKSSMGNRRIGGEVIERSRRTYEHAINGPVGQAMEGLMMVLDSLKLAKSEKIPKDIKLRFERLIDAYGEGGDHAVSMITKNIAWLFNIDPNWIKQRVLPWFDFDNDLSEPAWNGYLSSANYLPAEIGIELKPLFLKIFPRIYDWNWSKNLTTIATQILIELTVFHEEKPYGFTAREARQCIRNMNEQNRQDAIHRLSTIGRREENGWELYVIPFVNIIWPRERRLRSSNIVMNWINLLNGTGDCFPLVFCAIRKFIVPIDSGGHWLYQFSRENGGDECLTVRYPSDVLELLDAVTLNNAESVPYELAQILDLIEESKPELVSDRRFIRLRNLVEKV